MNRQGLQATAVRHQLAQPVKIITADGLLLLEVFEAMEEQRGLIFGWTAIPTERLVLPTIAVDSRSSDVVHRIGSLEYFFVIGRQRPALSATEILGGLEAETGRIAERADRPAFPGGAMGLGGIFDNLQSVFVGDHAQGRHVSRLAE